MNNPYSSSRLFTMAIFTVFLGVAFSGVLWEADQALYGETGPNPFGLDSNRTSVYFDDIEVSSDGNTLFSSDFDSSLSMVGWKSVNNVEAQRRYSHSPNSAVAVSAKGEWVSWATQDITINEGWKMATYSAWVMVPDDFSVPQFLGYEEGTFCGGGTSPWTGLFISSGSSFSNIGGGVVVQYLKESGTFQAYTEFFINIQVEDNTPSSSGGDIANTTAVLTPYRWYRLSIVLDSIKEQAQFYLDDRLVAQLPLSVELFETFDEISLWGQVP